MKFFTIKYLFLFALLSLFTSCTNNDNKDRNIDSSFTYTVYYESEGDGYIEAKTFDKDNNSKQLKSGESFTGFADFRFTAQPTEKGYMVDWYVNDTLVKDWDTYTLKSETLFKTGELNSSVSTVKIIAKFRKARVFVLNYKLEGKGTITAGYLGSSGVSSPIHSGDIVPEGKFIKFTVIPQQSGKIASWSVNSDAFHTKSNSFTIFTNYNAINNGSGAAHFVAKLEDVAPRYKLNYRVQGNGTLQVKVQLGGFMFPLQTGDYVSKGQWLSLSYQNPLGKTNTFKIGKQTFSSPLVFKQIEVDDYIDQNSNTLDILVQESDYQGDIKIHCTVDYYYGGASYSDIVVKKYINGSWINSSCGDRVPQDTKIQMNYPDSFIFKYRNKYNNSNYEIKSWELPTHQQNGGSTFEFVATRDKSILGAINVKIHLKEAKRKVNYSIEGTGGSISCSSKKNTFASGDMVKTGHDFKCTATPDTGKVVESWKINGVSQSLPLNDLNHFSFRLNSNSLNGNEANITASFRDAESVILSFEPETTGGGVLEKVLAVAPDGSLSTFAFSNGISVKEGSYLRFIPKPDAGRVARNWKLNDQLIDYPYVGKYTNHNRLLAYALQYFVNKKDAKAGKIKISVEFVPASISWISYKIIENGVEQQYLTDVAVYEHKLNNWEQLDFSDFVPLDENFFHKTIGTELRFKKNKTCQKPCIIDWKINGTIRQTGGDAFKYTVQAADTIEGQTDIIAEFRDRQKLNLHYTASAGGSLQVHTNHSGNYEVIANGDSVYEATIVNFMLVLPAGKTVDKWLVNGQEKQIGSRFFEYTLSTKDATSNNINVQVTLK